METTRNTPGPAEGLAERLTQPEVLRGRTPRPTARLNRGVTYALRRAAATARTETAR